MSERRRNRIRAMLVFSPLNRFFFLETTKLPQASTRVLLSSLARAPFFRSLISALMLPISVIFSTILALAGTSLILYTLRLSRAEFTLSLRVPHLRLSPGRPMLSISSSSLDGFNSSFDYPSLGTFGLLMLSSASALVSAYLRGSHSHGPTSTFAKISLGRRWWRGFR